MSVELDVELADVEELPREVEEDRKGFELIDGAWVEKGMGTQAAAVGNNLHVAVGSFVRANKLGLVMNAEGGFRLFASSPKLVRKPDLSFVANGRFPNNKPPSGNANLAPDLAAEVVSPNDLAEPLEAKIDEYLRAGVRLVWVLYIPTKSVWALKPDGTAVRKKAGEHLDGGDVLPGFTVPVDDLFEGV